MNKLEKKAFAKIAQTMVDYIDLVEAQTEPITEAIRKSAEETADYMISAGAYGGSYREQIVNALIMDKKASHEALRVMAARLYQANSHLGVPAKEASTSRSSEGTSDDIWNETFGV